MDGKFQLLEELYAAHHVFQFIAANEAPDITGINGMPSVPDRKDQMRWRQTAVRYMRST